jgi:hypothetical protein
MKKFFLVLASVAVMWSCSNDSEETITLNEEQAVSNHSLSARNSNASLEELYAEMLASESYIAADSATSDFMDRMNFDNSFEIKTEDDIFQWIEKNVSSTTFTDLTDARERWDSVKNLHGLAYDNNLVFYDELEKVTLQEFQAILPVPEPPTEADSCPQCTGAFTKCNMGAGDKYAETKQVVNGLVKASPGDQGVKNAAKSLLARANVIYNSDLRACKSTFDSCCN